MRPTRLTAHPDMFSKKSLTQGLLASLRRPPIKSFDQPESLVVANAKMDELFREVNNRYRSVSVL